MFTFTVDKQDRPMAGSNVQIPDKAAFVHIV